jgi:hypothetical protein
MMTKALTATLLTSVSLVGLGGCGGSESSPTSADAGVADAAADMAPATIIPKETVGGEIPPPSRDAEMEVITLPTPYEPTEGCCPVTLWIADQEGNETTALVVGDLPPLKDGVPLMWKDGRWSASVCLPRDEQITYRFFFGQKPQPVLVDPVEDGGVADAGADAAGEDAAGGESPDADLPLVDDYRANPEFPTAPNDDGTIQNVYPAVSVCGTTGT